MTQPTDPSDPPAPQPAGHSLSPAAIADFHAQGWVALRGALSPELLAEIDVWVDQIEDWALMGGPGLHHFEATEQGPRLARSEELIEAHPGLRGLLCQGAIAAAVGALLGEPAVLYKEKINHKQPGGAGFAPHQDAPAYRFVDHHISVMVPLDPATSASGGLSFAEGHRRGRLPDERGRLLPEVVVALDWAEVEAQPGDLLLFDSYAPHRSGPNTTDRPRRALYLTYNAARHGDHRARYYADKRAEFEAAGASFDGERARISVNDDFLGKPTQERPKPRALPIAQLFARYASPAAHQLYDEAITELEHGLQCAALAAAAGEPEAVVAACLLHDVGHLIVGDLFPIDQPLPRDFRHEEVGARYLERWFGPEITEPVRLHVAAKRYLAATDPRCLPGLSPSSIRSLAVQGGPMSPEEQRAFEATPHFAAAIAVRRADDAGKDPALVVPAFVHHEAMLRRLARA